ncbi:MAG: patatin-like phospholipase family protein [Streptosporangiaceae bacterium]
MSARRRAFLRSLRRGAPFSPGGTRGLVDAVAASCAVPGVWPPVTIGGRRYVDGGVRSSDNADPDPGLPVEHASLAGLGVDRHGISDPVRRDPPVSCPPRRQPGAGRRT